ncbi:type I restriction endonuclease subunit R [Natronogracilivirga saccharolytica]|uniref:Type I restriction enzyme endonuclease subunit n=1 Tax=Natronogracilivirga saccharolytica TaxID=2812953 RepID=A0A8J7RHS1_9BACT|nr:HsdR family type I site-specific deoxyribonuclease [Natronogracilivirga saccharolytica]MBP3192055.1 HsdR family type I site-specific deoxyribonuclease [Natronogracilivirga saccharolytica]
MTTVGQKEKITQQKVTGFFQQALGYRYLGHWKERSGNANVEEAVLRQWLHAQGHDEKIITKVLREIDQAKTISGTKTLYDANRRFYSLLRYGVKVKPDISEQTVTVWLIDWQTPGNNDFAIAEEVTVEGQHAKRPDVVLYVNGIALGILELKRSKVSVTEGIQQNLGSQKKEFIESFYSTVQYVMAGNETEGLRYGVIETPQKYWLRWKESEALPEAGDNPLLRELRQICSKDRFLELIHDFIVFDSGVKKACRHNQYFGVKAAQEHVRSRENGIIWHTQGSGKSLTMVWLAKWIREYVKDARVLMITDRKELDEQIESVFKGVDEDIYRTQSGMDLVNALNEHQEWLMCSLIHKFGSGEDLSEKDIDAFIEEIQKNLRHDFKPKGNIFVFVDECHRTQSGKLHRAMKKLLPDAVFFGFTGTPLLKKDKQTSIEVFGPYIHTYKFDEGVSDGVILDLRYEARDIDQNLTSQDKIDQWFDAKTRGLSDLGRAQIKKRWGTLQKVLSSQDRLNKIVSDLLMDMETRDRLRSGMGNAMLVTEDIYAACRVYEMFQKTDLAGKCAIITSYSPHHSDIKGEETGEGQTENIRKYEIYRKMLAEFFDEPEDTAINKTDQFEKEVKRRFTEEPGRMKLLIVVDKLLTGFDAPPATYLYIDKKMRDHGLFQAICRVNRLHSPDKEYGYIIDYKDLFKSLKQSIEDYTGEALDGYDKEDVEGLLKDRLKDAQEKLEQVRESIKALCEPVEPPYDTAAYVAYFVGPSDRPDIQKDNEPKRLELYKLTSSYLRAYAELANEMADAGYSGEEAKTIKEEVTHYESVREEVKLASGDYVDMKMYEPAMRHLLDTYIRADESEVISSFDDLSLVELVVEQGEKGLDNLPENIKNNPEAMAETIENNVRKLIIDEMPVNPKYYENMSQLLDELIEQRRREAIEYREYLKKIVELTKKVSKPESGGTYPPELKTPALRALYDNLDEIQNDDGRKAAEPPVGYGDKEDLKVRTALQLDQAIKNVKKAGWRGNHFKEREIKIAIRSVVKDNEAVEKLFDLVKNHHEY